VLFPLPGDVAFPLAPITLFVLTTAPCLLALSFRGIHYVLTSTVCSLTLLFPSSLVLVVAVGPEREPHSAKLVARLSQLVP
jgi:hypothetical protein